MSERKSETQIKELNEIHKGLEKNALYLYIELSRYKALIDDNQYAKYRFAIDDIATAALDVKKFKENLEKEHKTERSSVRGLLNRIMKK